MSTKIVLLDDMRGDIFKLVKLNGNEFEQLRKEVEEAGQNPNGEVDGSVIFQSAPVYESLMKRKGEDLDPNGEYPDTDMTILLP